MNRRDYVKQQLDKQFDAEEQPPSSQVEPQVRQGTDEESGEGWRRVEDELPKEKEIVLSFTAKDRYVTLRKYLNNNFCDPIGKCAIAGITHWMPLPQPPDA